MIRSPSIFVSCTGQDGRVACAVIVWGYDPVRTAADMAEMTEKTKHLLGMPDDEQLVIVNWRRMEHRE